MAKLTNTPLESSILAIEQRKSFAFSVSVVDIDGRPFSLSAATVIFTMGQVQQPGQDPVVVLTRNAVIPADTSGSCTISLQADELDFPVDAYPFTIVLRISGYSLVLVKGEVHLAANTEWASEGFDYVPGPVTSGFVVQMQGTSIIQVTVTTAPPGYDGGLLPVGSAANWTVPTADGAGGWMWRLPRNADWTVTGDEREVLNKPNVTQVGNRVNAVRVTLTATSDASLTSVDHALQIGASTAANFVADNNEIMARNNGAAATLGINLDGGSINLGAADADVTAPGRLRLTKTTDVTLASTDHALQIGATTAANLAMDSDELQARNNGAAAAFGINLDGGNINLGAASSTVAVPGALTTGSSTATTIRGTSTTDASLSSTAHALQLGPTTGLNLIADGDEIMARNNGATATFGVNADGGDVNLGGIGSVVSVLGSLVAGLLQGYMIRATSTVDVNLTSTDHAFQIGPTAGSNLAVDANEIQSRNNGASSSVYLNNDGGDVTLGNAASVTNVPGSLAVPLNNVPWRMASGAVSITPSAASTPTPVAVTFPAGRFTTPPVVMTTPLTGVPGSTVLGTSALNPTTSGATIYLTRASTVATPVQWFAYAEA